MVWWQVWHAGPLVKMLVYCERWRMEGEPNLSSLYLMSSTNHRDGRHGCDAFCLPSAPPIPPSIPPSVPRLTSGYTHTHTHTQEKERWLGLGWARLGWDWDGLGWAEAGLGMDWARSRLGWAGLGLAGLGRGLGWLRLGWAWLGWAGMGCLPSPAFRPPPSTWLPSLRASHPSHTHLATHPPSVPRLPSPALHLATHNSCGLVAAQALEEGRGHIEMVRGQQTPSCSSSKDLKHG